MRGSGPDPGQLLQLIEADKRACGFSLEQVKCVLKYYEILFLENQEQNLTRLDSPSDFYRGHFVDSIELVASGFVHGRVLDFGSGCGVPGILAAILMPESKWTLAESELGKSVFLEKAVLALGLSGRIDVFYGRGEDFLKNHEVDFIVSRAVGSIDKLFRLISKCSTWNNIVLMKGPKWEEEKRSPLFGRDRNGLRVRGEYRYQVEAGDPFRVIANISRVPRGTHRNAQQ